MPVVLRYVHCAHTIEDLQASFKILLMMSLRKRRCFTPYHTALLHPLKTIRGRDALFKLHRASRNFMYSGHTVLRANSMTDNILQG